jgi:glycosyltransferase involved in cell wall biosynthesis
MSDNIESICYIIGYRESNHERKEALLFVLLYLRELFPTLEILVVEQDVSPKFNIGKSLDIRHVFIQNSGLYNRCWGFNVGAKNTKKQVLAFGDSDLFLKKEDFLTCFKAAENFEAITPNKTEAINIAIRNQVDFEFEVINTRPLYTFAGGLVILRKAAFEKIGGWDERFEGWGGEDDAFSHVIYNRLTSKTFKFPFYHIDHPRTSMDGNQQEKYQDNKYLAEEITAINGAGLDRYIRFLKNKQQGSVDKYNTPSSNLYRKDKLNFVLAITTFNRLGYLKNCVDSFLSTRDSAINWQLIIADDNSNDGTKAYLEELQKEHDVIIIHNDKVDIIRQVNAVLKTLLNMDFTLCFRCDDDVVFRQPGWDLLYWQIIERTGIQHLIFYDKNWFPIHNLERPIQRGNLLANCSAENIQGTFYTLTKEIIQTVGFFDEQQFGRRGFGHVDYSFRCCRAGFNVITTPFDVVGSNDFIELQGIRDYKKSIASQFKSLLNPKEIIDFKKELIKTNRLYIPYNENFQSRSNELESINKKNKHSFKKSSKHQFQKADANFYPERGITGFLGFLLKRFYNWTIEWKLYFIPSGIKKIGRVLNKISIDLLNIGN